MKPPRTATPPRQSGFAILEVMVALLICSFGILGVVGLQAAMTRAQTANTFRAEAAYLAQQLIGTMWADRIHLDDFATATCARAACTTWQASLASRLPSGASTVTVDAATGVVTIEIRWTPAGASTNRFITATAITNS